MLVHRPPEAQRLISRGKRPLGGLTPILLAAGVLAALFLAMAGLRRAEPMLAKTALGARLAKYLVIVGRSWCLAGATVATLWAIEMRSGRNDLWAALDEIGLNARLPTEDTAMWSMGMLAAVTLAGAGVLFLRKLAGAKATQAALDVLPVTAREKLVFAFVVAPTAGFVEELVFRGFINAELWGLVGNGWIAAVLSSALFGLVHLYQGWWGVARTGVIGFIFASGVVVTGSLVPSMIAHTLADMFGSLFPLARDWTNAARPKSSATPSP